MSAVSANLGQPILTQILPSITPALEVFVRQMTTTMTPSIDNLINQLISLRGTTSNALVTAVKAGAIDAVVLSNSTLSTPAGSNTEPLVQITIAVGKQQYQLSSKSPLPVGTQLQLKLSDNNLALIVKIVDQKGQVLTPATTAIAIDSNSEGSTRSSANPLLDPRLAVKPQAASNPQPATNTTNTLENSPLSARPVIEQSIRQSLPLQQPLKLLLPLLQQLSAQHQLSEQHQQALPKEISQQISQLLKQFASPEQIQQPHSLKRAISNSGIFFEARLAQATNKKGAGISDSPSTKSLQQNAINADIKGLMQRLLFTIEQAASKSGTANTAVTVGTALSTEYNQDLMTTYTGKPVIPTNPDSASSANAAANHSSNNEASLDVLLRQLSRQLLASLARTQLSQLESIAGRQQNSPDNQAPVNSWNLDIPIMHGKFIDNLQLRIDQHEQDKNRKNKNHAEKLWVVMLNFDLHSLGKMNVQLNVIGTSVSATVWSQLEPTHQQVKQHIQQLKNNLEKIGVSVKQIECQLGQPPKTNMPIYYQLVDIRT